MTPKLGFQFFHGSGNRIIRSEIIGKLLATFSLEAGFSPTTRAAAAEEPRSKAMKQYLDAPELKRWIGLNCHSTVGHEYYRLDDTRVQELEQFGERNTMPSLSKYHQINNLPSLGVDLKCQAFSKCKNQKVEDGAERNTIQPRTRQEKHSRVTAISSSTASEVDKCWDARRLQIPPKTPRSSSEIGETPASIRENSIVFGKHRKRVSPHLLQSTPTECSGTILQIRRLKCKYQDILPPTSRLETRSTSMTSRRQFHRDSSVERLGSQRVRQRDRVNVSESVTAPATIVILRSSKQQRMCNRNTYESRRGTLINDDYTMKSVKCGTTINSRFSSDEFSSNSTSGSLTSYSEDDVHCNETLNLRHQTGRERPNLRSMLDSTLTEKCRSLVRPVRTSAILQDTLAALECAHSWNEWGTRTLHQLAKTSKATVDRNHQLQDSSCIHRHKDHIRLGEEPEIFLPYDNDAMKSTRQGRVLESREEERAFVRNLLIVSGLTKGTLADKQLLNAKQHIINQTSKTIHRQHWRKEDLRALDNAGNFTFKRRIKLGQNPKKLVDRRILYDFIEEQLNYELLLRKYAQPGINLTALLHDYERNGQELVQKVWNNLQTGSSPNRSDTCKTERSMLQKDLKTQDLDFICETVEVITVIEKMIYGSLVQELLKDLIDKTSCTQNKMYPSSRDDKI
uniref:DUF4378 domain-containing protein n=1 Tax=Physcomitrium patens TaxID=3218 RepID=A0A7I4DH58_PHYPA